ncbi:hypothetical protein DICVIV_06186 [Dictyocaulus viviparus]|uniref:Uncharacterized protein n=1 Tax=Dictyocaulus viviparus TaxID=29172 RepID=A0A0D8XVC8_DICVI|nr:hypothetical protein DICVIV_06186 [Dictyocaulus viviparus]
MCQDNITILSTQVDYCHNNKVAQTVPNVKEEPVVNNLRVGTMNDGKWVSSARTLTFTSINGNLTVSFPAYMETAMAKEKVFDICGKKVIDLQNSLSRCQELTSDYARD